MAARFHLYAAPACPWSHRTIIARRLRGLEASVSLAKLHPYRDERGWAMPGGEFTDSVNGFAFLEQAYRTDPGNDGRISSPLLWDRERETIVSNDSARILRMMSCELDGPAGAPDLYPAELRDEIDSVSAWIQEDVNTAVYLAGFAQSQADYDAAYGSLFTALDELERRLSSQRYLCGSQLTEADIRLFCTLVRFDLVYYTHYRCNGRRIVDYPALWGFTRDLYQTLGIGETVEAEQIKVHYYTTQPEINPSGVIAAGPEDLDFDAAHGRDRLARPVSARRPRKAPDR